MEPEVKKHAAVVIGGANMDICGSPRGILIAEDSNPGAVSVKPGGVGRNIAHISTLPTRRGICGWLSPTWM